MALTDRFETATLTPLHWAAAILAAITGVLHLFLAMGGFFGPLGVGLGVAFLLAGLGYLGGIYLGLVDFNRPLLYAAGIPFTAIQIVLWYVINFDSIADLLANAGTLGYVDKAVQIALILVLAVLYARDS